MSDAHTDTRPVRIIQVGLGHWGRNWAELIVPKVPAVETVAWVDAAPAALAAGQNTLGLPPDRCFSSVEDAVARVDAEGLLGPVTTPAHAAVVEAGARSGTHVLIEKPFAPDLAEAERLAKLAEQAGIILHVSQNYRFRPAAATAARMVAEGCLGAVLSIDVEFTRLTTGPSFPYYHVPNPLLVDMSIHHFDLMRMLLRTEPRRVACWSWNPPGSRFTGHAAAAGMIGFEDVMVTYRANEVSRLAETPWSGRWRIECEGGVIDFTSRMGGGNQSLEADRVTVTEIGGEAYEHELDAVPYVGRAGTLTAFATAVRGQQPPSYTATAADNLGTIALMEAMLRSAKNGGQPTPVGRI